MYELEREESARAAQENQHPKTYRMFFTRDLSTAPDIHRGRLNLPISNEIAAVFIDNDGAPPQNIDVVIHSRHEPNSHHINHLSPNCDPMLYPLFFPHGEQGKNWLITFLQSLLFKIDFQKKYPTKFKKKFDI